MLLLPAATGVLYEQGKLDAAIATYHKALTIEPSFPEAYNNLGNALREAGRYDEAIACYSACIQLQYSKAVQTIQLQQLQHHGGQVMPDAAVVASTAVAAAAAAAGSSGGLMGGLAAMAASRPPQALLPPGVAQRVSVAYNNLGGILKMTGQALAAIACYEQVVLLQPESPEGHANLASAYKDAARHDVAIASYRRALALRPDFPEAFANFVHSLQCVCDWTERPALFARLEQEVGCMGQHLGLEAAYTSARAASALSRQACWGCIRLSCAYHVWLQVPWHVVPQFSPYMNA